MGPQAPEIPRLCQEPRKDGPQEVGTGRYRVPPPSLPRPSAPHPKDAAIVTQQAGRVSAFMECLSRDDGSTCWPQRLWPQSVGQSGALRCARTHAHTHPRTHIYTRTHTHRHTYTHARTHTHTHAQTHMHTRTHTHTQRKKNHNILLNIMKTHKIKAPKLKSGFEN